MAASKQYTTIPVGGRPDLMPTGPDYGQTEKSQTEQGSSAHGSKGDIELEKRQPEAESAANGDQEASPKIRHPATSVM